MYHLHTRLDSVKGIGDVLFAKLQENGLTTVGDFLMNFPLRYEDFSNITTVEELKRYEPNAPFTIKVRVLSSSQFYKNRRSILSARIADNTGKLQCTWFNNRFLAPLLKKSQETGAQLYVSGKTQSSGTLTQPRVEEAHSVNGEEKETLHTGRLVPVYTSTLDLPQGKIRRFLKEILDHLDISQNALDALDAKSIDLSNNFDIPLLKEAFTQSHFPDTEERVIRARERFALEEVLGLIQQSKAIKKHWQENNSAPVIAINKDERIPAALPFQLTAAQKKATHEILEDLQLDFSMNRLLIGDVGSGKTVVAGIAANHILKNGFNVSLVAPTQILAEQHAASLQKIFPEIKVMLVTAKNSKHFVANPQPTLYVGTHALINRHEVIAPAFIIFDEQHRFGVAHRSQSKILAKNPHILTMTATPIPRSLMLTIFSHLNLSALDELPPGRVPIKTWLVPEKKRADGFSWVCKELLEHHKKTGDQGLAIVVCPFIDPSHHQAFENIASATETFESVKKAVDQLSGKQLTTALLHGRLTQPKKDAVIKKLFDKSINVLVTTPIVEVGLDLPNANIIIIEAAQRFGLASLHQLRGRVGRSGQKSYCLLFTSSQKESNSPKRLKIFCEENNGMKLAEFDMKNRGAGSIFGTVQSGFSDLKFASWTNLELLSEAQKIASYFEKKQISWLPIWEEKQTLRDQKQKNPIPLAN